MNESAPVSSAIMPTLMAAFVMAAISHELCARCGASQVEKMPWSTSQHALL
jgi:hypothetical protein